MKKVLFAIAALASCMTASAQLWVSGGLNLDNQSYWNDDDTRTSWSLEPAIGYALDDALEVGLSFGIGGSSKGDDKSTNFSIAPFARYTFLSEGDFSMFVQGQLGYTYHKDKNPLGEDKSWSFGVSFCPGIKYALTDQFAIVATFGNLYFDHDDSDWGGAQNGFGLNINSGLNFGLVYSF